MSTLQTLLAFIFGYCTLTLGKIIHINKNQTHNFCDAVSYCDFHNGTLVHENRWREIAGILSSDLPTFQATWVQGNSTDAERIDRYCDPENGQESQNVYECPARVVLGKNVDQHFIKPPIADCRESSAVHVYIGVDAVLCADGGGVLRPAELSIPDSSGWKGTFCQAHRSCARAGESWRPPSLTNSSKIFEYADQQEIPDEFAAWVLSRGHSEGEKATTYCADPRKNRLCPGELLIRRISESSIDGSIIGCNHKLPAFCDVPDGMTSDNDVPNAAMTTASSSVAGEDEGISTAIIAGAAAGGAVVLIVIIVVIVIVMKRRKQGKMKSDPTVPVTGLTPNPTFRQNDYIRSTVSNLDLIGDAISQNASMQTLDPKLTLNSQISSQLSQITVDFSTLSRLQLPPTPPPDVSYDVSATYELAGDVTGQITDVRVTNLDTGRSTMSTYENVGDVRRDTLNNDVTVKQETNIDSGYSTVVDDEGHYDVIGDMARSQLPETSDPDIPVYAQPNKVKTKADATKLNIKRMSDSDDVTIVDNTVYA